MELGRPFVRCEKGITKETSNTRARRAHQAGRAECVRIDLAFSAVQVVGIYYILCHLIVYARLMVKLSQRYLSTRRGLNPALGVQANDYTGTRLILNGSDGLLSVKPDCRRLDLRRVPFIHRARGADDSPGETPAQSGTPGSDLDQFIRDWCERLSPGPWIARDRIQILDSPLATG